jgi:type IV secretion system protein VirD4
LEVDKYDYSKHPEAKKLRSCKASSHVPEWRRKQQKQAVAKPTVNKPTVKKAKPAATAPAPEEKPAQKAATAITITTKESIMAKKKEE